MGETRVDLLHLLEDLRDAYPETIEETILTEIVANSLDSGASLISFSTHAEESVLVVRDNGSGMYRKALAKYHNIAASSKTRGQGIGFAGVGIKLGLLVCEEVYTESRRGQHHIATCWGLTSRHRAPWKWVPPIGLLVGDQGTALRLTLHNALSPLLDPGFVEASVSRHFAPLLDSRFDDVLSAQYPKGVTIQVNGAVLSKSALFMMEQIPIQIRLMRKRKPSACGYLSRTQSALPAEERGIAVSTLGKVIKRGWDWLGVTPTIPDCIHGLIEVPALSACLTLNKGDFVRVGSRGAMYLAYRKAMQEAISQQLEKWGDSREITGDSRTRLSRPLERDLRRVLEDLAEDFPLLDSLVERRAGGQKRLPLGQGEQGETADALISNLLTSRGDTLQERSSSGDDKKKFEGTEAQLEDPSTQGSSEPSQPHTRLPERGGQRRPARYGLDIQFEDRPASSELGRLVDTTVWVNLAHPAYRRAEASRSVGYHLALTVAMALSPLAVEPVNQHTFIAAFLGRWGETFALSTKRSTKHREKSGIRD